MSKEKTGLIKSESFNPWYNLALEEYLVNNVARDEVILYLWQNDNTVVIGRNQNAWKECRNKELEADQGKLARRLSGGGAVYHDLGNLNFTFVMDRTLYDLNRQLKVLLNAVKQLGIEAEFSGRNDLVVEGRKFSGNAFYFTNEAAYHHGTLLVNSDFSKLSNYLQVSSDKIKAKGVDSVRSRVVNLIEYKSDITITEMEEAVQDSFIAEYGGSKVIKSVNPAEMEELVALYDKYSSWDWRFGKTPDFDITFQHRFTWGGIEFGLKLKNGLIQQAQVYSDAMDADLIEEISRHLFNVPFRLDDMINSLAKIETDQQGKNALQELNKWLAEELS